MGAYPWDGDPGREIARHLVATGGSIRAVCPKCAKQYDLYWNDGELSYAECCGLVMALEHLRVDFVIREAPRE